MQGRHSIPCPNLVEQNGSYRVRKIWTTSERSHLRSGNCLVRDAQSAHLFRGYQEVTRTLSIVPCILNFKAPKHTDI
jgi:hypothetical protein